MRKLTAASLSLALAGLVPAIPVAHAQDAVTASPDAEALFTDRNPKLNANKQAAYHIMKDLLEAGHWELADKYLTARYIQHNPNVPNGRQAVVDFFHRIGAKPKPIPKKLGTPVVQVIAQGDYVMVATVSTMPTPSDPTKTYTTTWFDLWRFVGGKADEHWDSSPLMR